MPMAVLAGILEKNGCEVIIASVRDFAKTIRWWNPHATVINTPSVAKQVKNNAPNAKIIFLDGEGYKIPEKSRAKWWMENREEFELLDEILVWGKSVLEDFERESGVLSSEKVHIIGNPKLDLVRFLPEIMKKKGETNSLGLVCRFHSINHHAGIPGIRMLATDLNNLQRMVSMVYAWEATLRALHAILERTDFRVSIRPHPSESVEGYKEFVIPYLPKEWRARVTVDETLDFASWALKQKALVSPTSTSFLEAYLLKIPVANLDKISNTEEYNKGRAQVASQWQKGGYLPGSLEELCDLLKGDMEPTGTNPEIEKQLDVFCNWNSGKSACKRAAEIIIESIASYNPPTRVRVTKMLIEKVDNISFKRACRSNRLHPNFNYKKGWHSFPSHLSALINNCIQNG